MDKIKKYWPELLVFSVIFGVLLTCCTPNYTWVNTDSDGIHYTYSAEYMYPAHKTSAPLFLLLGRTFLFIPMGTEAWRMALMSVLASTATAVFVYLIVKQRLGQDRRFLALLGSLIFGASALVISQSTIIETYALVTMFGAGAYYFALRQKWVWCAVMLGGGIAVHHLIGITILVLLVAFRSLRHWRYIGIMGLFLLFYLYLPITNREPYIWHTANLTESFIGDNATTALMLIGGLSIWDFPQRVLNTIGIVGASLGLAVIPMWFAFKGVKFYREPLFWLVSLPIIYYMIDLAPQTYVYIMPGIAFGAVLAAIGLSKMSRRWAIIVAIVTLFLLGFHANYFDIGRTLDPELSATKYYNHELHKVPNGDILLAQQGWEWAAVFSYNENTGSNIIPVCVGALPASDYRDQIKAQGVKVDEMIVKETLSVYTTELAQSILDLNDNVWLTVTTDPRTFGAEVVPGEGNEHLLVQPVLTAETVSWQWMPSNPYDIITGAIEVEEWRDIVWSNYSMLTIIMMSTIGGVPAWIGYQVLIKKKKWHFKNPFRKEE